MSDAELITRYLAGDEQAFAQLYANCRKPVYAYLYRFFPGRHDLVDDIFQQVWIRVIDSLGRYRHQDRFLSWVLRIAHHLAIDYCRR